MYKDYSINKFIEELSSDLPAPGGGGAAALAGAIGAALGAMVFSLTVNKKIYQSYDEATKKIVDDNLQKLINAKNEFLDMIDKDAQAFTSLMDTFKLPKTTEEEQKLRKAKLQEGYEASMEAPLNVAKKAYEIFDYILSTCEYGNKGVISDAGVAAIMLQAAIEASVLNVRVNLAYIENENHIFDINTICDDLIREGLEKRTEILAKVYGEIEK
ncbi:cyclodeaminase/cyclohydrolase family protein [Clostridium oryzae]|uniref:Methenyltetrahydrofolate cyclohydrolase n=1 Tax=Clostridium oryzae TaxID=1450648 RepID=A0A1V4IRF1_9CLOT|nr:cyclodeaminase/cyclohydrolase family protein [Clostridium oryzae]OPJ62384.1 methenyltetrahydrofolate cyclohydrolase [Clostridium oryzae]